MSTFLEFIIFEKAHEHVLEHVPEHVFEHEVDFNLANPLSNKRNYSDPKIYTGNTNLNKRWYIYFSFRNPETGKLERMKNIYGDANRYKTKSDRMAVLTRYRSRLLKLLRLGFNPFEDNLELFLEMKKKGIENMHAATPVKESPKKHLWVDAPKVKVKTVNKDALLDVAFTEALARKKRTVSESTIKGYTYSTNLFLAFLKKHYTKVKTVDEIEKKMVLEFLNQRLQTTSSKTYNNTRTNLSALMQDMVDNDLAPSNVFLKIKRKKTKPQMHKTYSPEMVETIFNYLEQHDPILLLYIKFVSYNFLRPIEVNRLKIGSFDLKNKTIQFKAKNKPSKLKRLPQIIFDELPDLSKMDPEHWLFTPQAIGEAWDASDTNRRDHFTKRFKYVVKDKLKLGEDFTIYSFRHTFITKLYRELRKKHPPETAKGELMLITGHQTMDALNRYLRDIDAELPDEYSNLLMK